MAMNFQAIINNMQSMGFFQYLFPFLLALAILYGLFENVPGVKTKFPKPAKAMISIILAFFVMLYSSWNPMISTFFANMGGTFLVLASGILFILLLAGLIGFDPFKDLSEKNNWFKYGGILLIVFFLILVLMGSGAGWLIPIPYISMSSDFWTAVFVIAIIAIAFWGMTKSGGGTEAPKTEEPKK
ncbi:MAG: hypothetical protein JW716_01995 [Candidatus Aenigmarchaeota archaeon]|nr:hypothetical protein [Candidatus Aenigmarchaeota archaeon]